MSIFNDYKTLNSFDRYIICLLSLEDTLCSATLHYDVSKDEIEWNNANPDYYLKVLLKLKDELEADYINYKTMHKQIINETNLTDYEKEIISKFEPLTLKVDNLLQKINRLVTQHSNHIL